MTTDWLPQTPQSTLSLIKLTVCAYFKYFMELLPFICLIIGLHFLMGVLPKLPSMNQKLDVLWSMGSILLLPLVGGFLIFQQSLLSPPTQTLKESLKISFSKLIPLVASLISLVFIPLILIFLGSLGFLFLESLVINLSILGIACLLSFLWLANKMSAPILILLENSNLDANAAQNHAVELARKSYLRTLCLIACPILFTIGLFWLPFVLTFWWGAEEIPYAYLAFQGASEALIALIGPLMGWMVLLAIHDLKLRKK